MSRPLAAGCALSRFQVGVRRADDPVAAPRDHEQHARLRAQDQPAVELDAVARDDEVHALRCAHLELAALADHVLHVVRPHAGGVDDHPRPDVQLAAAVLVANSDTGHMLALAQKAHHRRVGRHGGAKLRGRARHGQGVTGVINLRVVILDRADERIRPQRRRELQRRTLGQVAMARQPVVATERVVEHHPRADVGALPALAQGEQEGDGDHEVGSERVEEQRALAQRLADEPEVALLEVAQPAVDELARATRRARGEVARLHERDRQAAGHRVERAAGARRAGADDDDVEDLAGRSLKGGAALVGTESAGIASEHRPSASARERRRLRRAG